MSTPPDEGNPLDRLLALRRAERERAAAGQAVGEEREQLWRDRLVAPVTAFAGGWAEAWEQFGAELGAGDVAASAVTYRQIDALLADLHAVWSSWSAAVEAWHAGRAVPWQQSYPGTGRFARLSPYHEPGWLLHWVGYSCEAPPGEGRGPAAVPTRVAGWVDRQTSPRHGPDGGHEAVYLLGLLGTGADPAAVEGYLSALPHRDRVAAVVLVLAAVVLPAPAVLDRFFAAGPPEDVLDLGGWVTAASAGVVGDHLRADYGRRHAEHGLAAFGRAPEAAPGRATDHALTGPVEEFEVEGRAPPPGCRFVTAASRGDPRQFVTWGDGADPATRAELCAGGWLAFAPVPPGCRWVPPNWSCGFWPTGDTPDHLREWWAFVTEMMRNPSGDHVPVDDACYGWRTLLRATRLLACHLGAAGADRLTVPPTTRADALAEVLALWDAVTHAPPPAADDRPAKPERDRGRGRPRLDAAERARRVRLYADYRASGVTQAEFVRNRSEFAGKTDEEALDFLDACRKHWEEDRGQARGK